MPYADPEEAKRKAKNRMQRLRGRTSGEQGEGEQQGEQRNVIPSTITEPSYVNLSTGEISDEPTTGRTGTKGTENTGLEGSHSKGEQTPSPCSVEHLFDPDTGLDWQPVKAFISKPQAGEMSNLERLQRVAGALGQRAEDVRFGLSGPTFKEIGKLLGKEEAAFPR